jgi:hypothetical protein
MISNNHKWGVGVLIDVCIQTSITHHTPRNVFVELEVASFIINIMHGKKYKFVETQNGPICHEHVLQA